MELVQVHPAGNRVGMVVVVASGSNPLPSPLSDHGKWVLERSKVSSDGTEPLNHGIFPFGRDPFDPAPMQRTLVVPSLSGAEPNLSSILIK